MNIPNLAFLRSAKPDHPEYGARLYEALKYIEQSHNNVEQQTNANATGVPSAPPPLQALTITPTETGVHASINHQGEFYRGIEYHLAYADNPHFTNPFPVSIGPAREADIPTGTKTLYWQAIGQYPTGDPTNPVFHGGATPQAVTGGTKSPLGLSQGSGTGLPGAQIAGYGPTQFVSKTGVPPPRKV